MDKYGIYMQHLENMTEDESFPAKERAKFKGWHKKLTMGRIPILACVAIELFAPAKILSSEWLTFAWCVAHRLELALKDALT